VWGDLLRHGLGAETARPDRNFTDKALLVTPILLPILLRLTPSSSGEKIWANTTNFRAVAHVARHDNTPQKLA
jgi:hypothetical protein